MIAKAKSIVEVGVIWMVALMFATGCAIGAMTVWWYYFQPQISPYVVINPDKHQVSGIGPDIILVHREFRIIRPAEITIWRELIRRDAGLMTRTALPTSVSQYVPGDYGDNYVHRVTTLTPGTYELHNKLCWKANPIRVDCMMPPILSMIIAPPPPPPPAPAIIDLPPVLENLRP